MKKLLLAVCALFGFMACTQNPIEEQSAIRTDAPETIKVGFEDNETRIQLNEAQKTVWTKDDLVSVFYKSDANQMWEYRGETGERVADLYRVDAGTASSKMSYVVLVYPYSTDYVLSTASGNIETTLPATQHYAADSYAVGENLMVSRSEFTQFSLKSVCGWLKLQLTGNGEVVNSIKFRGNNGEQVAGLIYVDTETAEATLASEMGGSDDNNAGGNLIFDDTVVTEVTLDCGEGVTLGAEATSFYIALPPQTFANGFTVDIRGNGYNPIFISTSNVLVIERNTIQPMASIEAPLDKIAYNEIWYTNGSTTTATTPNKTDVFGASIVSNTYDTEKECWVIKFDSDVTTIGENAFYGCSSLTSVTIPDSVTTIGNYAFRSCSSLTSVAIPDSVTSIGDYAFSWCQSLTSVTIPDSVTSIGKSAFYGCSSLTSVTIPDSVTSIGMEAFKGCTGELVVNCNIPDGYYNNGEHGVFIGSKFTSVTIGDSVTTIGDYAFNDSSSLSSITIPDSVTTIGREAFEDCSSLSSITIPDSVTSIGNYAFYNCSSLTCVTIGSGVTSIGGHAFDNCSNLTEFKGNYVSDDGRCLIIDGTLYSFLPAGLTEYTIPDGVTTIGGSAFYNCSSLTSVTIGSGVTSIGQSAFDDCSSLSSVYCMATTPPWMEYGAFENNDEWDPSTAIGCIIYVPIGSVDAYKSARGWNWYESYIRGYDFDSGKYTVILNNAWQQSTSVSNPNSSLYDGVYESYSNYNVDSSEATMYIDIEGYTEFSIYVRSNAESNYDYVTVSELDSATQKMSTKGNQNSGTALSSYAKVTYTGIDGGSHRITVTYKKDGSQHSGTDRGYLIIPKYQ